MVALPSGLPNFQTIANQTRPGTPHAGVPHWPKRVSVHDCTERNFLPEQSQNTTMAPYASESAGQSLDNMTRAAAGFGR